MMGYSLKSWKFFTKGAPGVIAILDYKAGNLTSVERAVRHLGFPCGITNSHEEIRGAERVIFPGVGAAGKSMESPASWG